MDELIEHIEEFSDYRQPDVAEEREPTSDEPGRGRRGGGARMIALLAQLDTPEPVDTPDIAWSALLPLVVLTVGAVLLVLFSSLMKQRLFRGFHAAFTVLTAAAGIGAAVYLWQRVGDEGPSSAVAGAVAVDQLRRLPDGGDLRRRDPGRPGQRLVPATRGPGRARVLRPHAPVGGRRDHHGDGQRPDRGLPRPRDPVVGRLRAGGHAAPPVRVAGGGHQVLRARRLLVGLLPLRHRLRVRGDRVDQPDQHLGVPGRRTCSCPTACC